MTAVQMQLNTELFTALQTISSDEGLMKKAVRSLKRIAAQHKADSTEMTREEFYAKLDKAEEEYKRGKYTTLKPGESVSDMLKRCGYDI